MKNQFSKICIEHGFQKMGYSYYRCIGEGIFQHIYTKQRERLPFDHPNYSSGHRYEQCICIYLKSMYEDYSYEIFEPPLPNYMPQIDEPIGHFIDVYDLETSPPTKRMPFPGWMDSCKTMCEYGLDRLDTITTQQQLKEIITQSYKKVYEIERCFFPHYDIYLYCGDFERAWLGIDYSFAEWVFTAMINNNEVQLKKAIDKIPAYYKLYSLAAPINRESAIKYLNNNFKRNVEKLKEKGIIVPEKLIENGILSYNF